MEADNLHAVKWWVDGAFAVHPDMKSHTGAMMSMGKGAMCGASTQQKLNTKSSTEAKLVGVDDAIDNSVICQQDNQSAMLLEKNGCGSSGKRTRHNSIRCFFVANRIASKEVRAACHPTVEMLTDFFTKPLQGNLFRMFRNFILNASEDLAAKDTSGKTS